MPLVKLPYRFLRTPRNQLLQPHRLALAIDVHLAQLGELFDALAGDLNDARWSEIAGVLYVACAKLRRI